MPASTLKSFSIHMAVLFSCVLLETALGQSSLGQSPVEQPPSAAPPAAPAPEAPAANESTAEPQAQLESNPPSTPEATPRQTAPPQSTTPRSPAPQSTAADDRADQDQLRFNFSGAPWGDVLQWFAEEADLSLQLDASPAGTVNFVDPNKTYTVAEGLDLINQLLLDRGWALVRRGRMLFLVDLEADNAEKIISELAELVTEESFSQRGNSDIVRCVFPLGGLTAEQAKEELEQLKGPWGRINVLAGARQVVVTETVGKLKVIGEILRSATQARSQVTEIKLQNRAAEEVLELARPIIGLEPGTNVSEDIRISVSLFGDRLFVTGDQNKVELLSRLVEKADVPQPGMDGTDDTEFVAPVVKTHTVATADLQTVFDVLQTLLAGTPEVRIALDTNRGTIIAYGAPDVQTRIEKTIAELEGDGRNFAMIDLRRLKPEQALLTINKFFGGADGTTYTGPTVDGDPETGRLWVRGTQDQIEIVKKLIEELENDPLAGGLGENVRILPLGGSSLNETIRQIEQLWPLTGRTNRLRVVLPNNDSRGNRSDQSPAAPEQTIPSNADESATTSHDDRTLVWQLTDQADVTQSETAPTGKGDIIVQLTPAGLVLASEDTDALDLLEQLINSLSDGSMLADDLPTIFRLKFIKADVASKLIAGVLGGADAGSSAGSLTESVMGGLGGGMLGGLLGLGGGGGGEESSAQTILTSRGNVNIVPDNRLNWLIVQGSPADVDFIRVILEEIDREESPEAVQTIPRPKLIPVIYQEAAEVAKIVKEVFGEKAQNEAQGGGGGRGGNPSPQDLINAIRGGGRGGRGGGEEDTKTEPTKIIVAVDARSNSLVVSATPQDFLAVQDLVSELDRQGMESEEIVEVLPLGGSVDPEIMRKAIESVLGQTVTTTNSSSTGSSSASSRSSSTESSGSSAEDIQRRIEFFRSRFGGGAPGGGPGGMFGGRGGAPGGGGAPSGGRPSGGGRSSGGGRGR